VVAEARRAPHGLEGLMTRTASTTRMTARHFLQLGVAHHWIVDPVKRTLEAFDLREGRYVPARDAQGDRTVALSPFSALSIPLKMLWRQ